MQTMNDNGNVTTLIGQLEQRVRVDDRILEDAFRENLLLRERVADLEGERNTYRELLQMNLEQTHALTTERNGLRRTVRELREIIRRMDADLPRRRAA